MDTFKEILLQFKRFSFDHPRCGGYVIEDPDRRNKWRNDILKELERKLPHLTKTSDPDYDIHIYLKEKGIELAKFCKKRDRRFLRMLSEKEAKYIIKNSYPK